MENQAFYSKTQSFRSHLEGIMHQSAQRLRNSHSTIYFYIKISCLHTDVGIGYRFMLHRNIQQIHNIYLIIWLSYILVWASKILFKRFCSTKCSKTTKFYSAKSNALHHLSLIIHLYSIRASWSRPERSHIGHIPCFTYITSKITWLFGRRSPFNSLWSRHLCQFFLY